MLADTNRNLRRPNRQELEREREQLLRTWPALTKITARPGVNLTSIQAQDGRATGMDFRKVHDRFGWMAKNHMNCAGAIYRSSAFICLPPESRCGSKAECPSHPGEQNVHIEHTVQASALQHVWNAREGYLDLDATLHWLLKHSVATAMVPREAAGLPSRNRDIPERPFERYVGSDLEIWNVLTGATVDFSTFTFEDHRTLIASLIHEHPDS